MAKKAKRQVRRTPPPAYSAMPSTAPRVSERLSERDFNPDYSYVVKDLKRIGTLAGVFFVILIGLSFFL